MLHPLCPGDVGCLRQVRRPEEALPPCRSATQLGVLRSRWKKHRKPQTLYPLLWMFCCCHARCSFRTPFSELARSPESPESPEVRIHADCGGRVCEQKFAEERRSHEDKRSDGNQRALRSRAQSKLPKVGPWPRLTQVGQCQTQTPRSCSKVVTTARPRSDKVQ